jgi:hypothetical protein
MGLRLFHHLRPNFTWQEASSLYDLPGIFDVLIESANCNPTYAKRKYTNACLNCGCQFFGKISIFRHGKNPAKKPAL